MDYFANMSSSMNDTSSFFDVASAYPAASITVLSKQSPLALGLTTVLTAAVSFLGYQAWRPSVHPQSPKFTKDAWPLFGSLGVIMWQWTFWKNATKESKTGNFSFWHGGAHVVGITGPSSRKLLLDHPDLDLVAAQKLLPFGIHFWPAGPYVPPAFQQHGKRARNNTYFLRTLLDLMKTDKMERVLPGVLSDAREYFDGLSTNGKSGIINAPVVWPTVLKQSTRLFFAEDISLDPELYARACKHLEVILHTFSPFYTFHHWIMEPSVIRRKIARAGLWSIAQKVYNDRKSGKTPRRNDAMQMMVDRGDPEGHILEFCTSGFFITTANAHIIFPRLIETLAAHVDWQEKCYQELVVAVNKYDPNGHGRLIDRLAKVPLRSWEDQFPILEMCRDEVVRAWTSFPVARLNVSDKPIPIPGSNEVIPAGAYGMYNSTEVNFDPNLFPDPHTFHPERFMAGRREFEKEPFGNFGFGVGQHPCPGKRYGKLQQNILVAHAIANYKWTRCDENGKEDPYAAQRMDLGADLDHGKKFDLPPAYCKYEIRE